MVDDHDIIDNWGSSPAHQRPEWRSVGEGALQASYDYQIARVQASAGSRPNSLHYEVTYGHTATFVMDLRSNRKAGAGGQLFSDAQKADIQHFLYNNRNQNVLFFVASVPVIHLPRHLARLVAMLPPSSEDFSDRWS